MSHQHIPRALVVGSCLWCLLCSSCSKNAATPQSSGSIPATTSGQRSTASRKKAGADAPDTHRKQAAASTTPRQHPFLPVVDTAAARRRGAVETGPLTLKAVLEDSARAAIIQQGSETHVVREGEYVGGATVLEIRADEVVIQIGQRKQVLPLYAP